MNKERKIYMEGRSKKHSVEEILTAFEDSYSICFELGDNRTPSTKIKLLTGVWAVNPDAIVTETDLCVLSAESTAQRKQMLLIDKNGDINTINKILDLMYESEAISNCYVTYKEKEYGTKIGVLQKFDSKTKVIKKFNLLIDGENLLLTVRSLSRADHEKKENSEE